MLERLLEQQQAICAVLLESENRDARLLMPPTCCEEFAVAKEVTQILKTLKPFILLLKLSVGKNIPPLALFTPSSTNFSQ